MVTLRKSGKAEIATLNEAMNDFFYSLKLIENGHFNQNPAVIIGLLLILFPKLTAYITAQLLSQINVHSSPSTAPPP